MSISFGGWSASGSVPPKYTLHIGLMYHIGAVFMWNHLYFLVLFFFLSSFFPQLTLDFLTAFASSTIYDSSDGIKTRLASGGNVSGANVPFDGRPLPFFISGVVLGLATQLGGVSNVYLSWPLFFTWDSILFYFSFLFFFFYEELEESGLGEGVRLTGIWMCIYNELWQRYSSTMSPLFISKSSPCMPSIWLTTFFFSPSTVRLDGSSLRSSIILSSAIHPAGRFDHGHLTLQVASTLAIEMFKVKNKINTK